MLFILFSVGGILDSKEAKRWRSVNASMFIHFMFFAFLTAVSTPTIWTVTVIWPGWPSGSDRGQPLVCSPSAPPLLSSEDSMWQRCRNTSSAAQVRLVELHLLSHVHWTHVWTQLTEWDAPQFLRTLSTWPSSMKSVEIQEKSMFEHSRGFPRWIHCERVVAVVNSSCREPPAA